MEDLAEADQDQVPWTDPGLMDMDTDRDSAQEAESGTEELARLKISGQDKDLEFEPFLCVLNLDGEIRVGGGADSPPLGEVGLQR